MSKEFFARIKMVFPALCLMLSFTGASLTRADSTELDKLLQLVDLRLQVMDDVALYKFAHGIPIENKKREQVVLASAVANAGKNHLKPASVEAFFSLQIQLAKQVQSGWTKQWRAEGKKPQDISSDIPDLKTDIRPKLISLGGRIVQQFPLALPVLHDPQQLEQNRRKIEQAINSPFISTVMKHKLLDAMAMVQAESSASQNQLSRILQLGVLRVGTTGDYRPFSFIESTDSDTPGFVGIDIDMAKDLADSLGVKLQLVKTSWPTLMADLAADRFDVGMSGISRSLKRRRTAFFSDQYFIGGKTAIGRCDAIAKLDSLEKIDQPSTRVIVNPGGTNQKFVQSNIKNARVTVYPDNTTIFEQIRVGYADVMITDNIEVKLQQRLHPELCATMPGKLFTYSEKGYLLPQDISLKQYLDGWLQQVKRNGKLEAAFARYLE
ncbi:MAG: gamma subclass chorismate mutase AroQ [Pseudomonadales bacterium]|nr:gamma subclass chorismate mutase AroQ [Pseudomonadales bacterium]